MDDEHEQLALTAVARAFAGGAKEHRERLPQGTLAARHASYGHWRIALFTTAGARVAIGSAYGACAGTAMTRTVAAVFRWAPAEPAGCDAAVPSYDVEAVGNLLAAHHENTTRSVEPNGSIALMVPEITTRCVEPNGNLTLTVPGAAIRIGPSQIHAAAATDGIMLALEGAWGTDRCAKVVDAMLRDTADAPRTSPA